ncbi:MAG TPA: sulfur carrier protein ThiS [Opitutaceae bacterium]|jgi:sulfur carrier protein|nr:sulfur carrier protein ThiS [Opitutaceae bacterium]
MSTATANSVIYVNDQPRPLAAPTTLLALLNELGHAGRKGVAVAINGAVVPRAEWPARALAEADHVLVIQATQGG